MLINWYTGASELGLHVDSTEESLASVISISIRDSCKFVIGGANRNDPKQTITLQSGDVMIIGGEHRLHYHGVKKILTNTAHEALGMK